MGVLVGFRDLLSTAIQSILSQRKMEGCGLSPATCSQVLRCLRVDRVTVAAAQFVAGNLGDRFVRPPVLDYKDLLQRSNPTTPIVFVLSPGADPAFGIFRLGELACTLRFCST